MTSEESTDDVENSRMDLPNTTKTNDSNSYSTGFINTPYVSHVVDVTTRHHITSHVTMDTYNTSFTDHPTTIGAVTFVFINDANQSENTTSPPAHFADLRDANIAMLAVILGLTILGNLTVIVYLQRRNKALSQMHTFIAHLSIADISVGLFNVFPRLVWDTVKSFKGNNFMCKSVKFSMTASIYASTYVMMMLAIDRYLSLRHASFRQNSRLWRVKLMVITAWVMACVFSLPQLFIFTQRESVAHEHGNASVHVSCWANFNPEWTEKLYTIWVCVVLFFIPLIVIVFCYGCISLHIWRFSKQAARSIMALPHAGPNGSLHTQTQWRLGQMTSHNEALLRRKHKHITATWMKTMKLSLTIVILYFVCWTPFIVVQMWTAYNPTQVWNHTAIIMVMRLASLNSCTNPWIYLIFACLWRKGLKSSLLTMDADNGGHADTQSSHIDLAKLANLTVPPLKQGDHKKRKTV